MKHLLQRGFVAVALVTISSSTASAQLTFDHLQCFKIKSTTAKALYGANVIPSDPTYLAGITGCTIKVPAKFLCVDSAKTDVDPVPPGAAPGSTAQKYFCYTAKCEKTQPTDTLTDQFGTHDFQVKVTKMVCAPVSAAVVASTTTTLPCTDNDLDSYLSCEGDCDDASASINPGAAEVCNGIDDDCDGVVDDGNPGGGGACATGLPGVCAAGTTDCSGGTIVCTQNVSSSPETCDGEDNDCDGVVDDGNPGGGGACATGLPGVCAAGTTSCSGGTIVCTQNVSSGPETCDGQDNDCDGIVDDGNPGGGAPCSTGLPGVCAAGTTSCSGGAIVCSQNVSPSAEVCGDGLDNDCDGVVDNGC